MHSQSDTLMEHVLSPRNGGAMHEPTVLGRASLAGQAPRVTIYLKLEGDVVRQAMFQTFGCGYSIACCSALTELVTELPVAGCLALTAERIVTSLGGIPEDRMFCADLAIEALRAALNQLPATPN